MMAKSCLLAGALTCIGATSPFPTTPPTIGNNDPRVALVECSEGSGSAVRIGRSTWVSVAHVTSNGNCHVGGEPIQELWQDPARDFSMFKLAPRPSPGMPIDCGGFVAGRLYLARGHARGIPEQTTVILRATGGRMQGADQAELKGIFAVVPGQSGGAVTVRETGNLVGVINTFNPFSGAAGSVPLSETHLCSRESVAVTTKPTQANHAQFDELERRA